MAIQYGTATPCADQLGDFGRSTINLLWINKELGDWPEVYVRDGQKISLNERLKGWAERTGLPVVMWYDSKTLTDAGKKACCASIKELANKGFNIQAQDVRTLDLLKSQRVEKFDGLDCYNRIDVLNLLIVRDAIECKGLECGVFTDLSLEPVERDVLYAQESLKPAGEIWISGCHG